MLGPVMMATRFSAAPIKVSLGTKRASGSICSTTGWRPPWISMTPDSSTSGRQ